jgi:hypothetical protein
MTAEKPTDQRVIQPRAGMAFPNGFPVAVEPRDSPARQT